MNSKTKMHLTNDEFQCMSLFGSIVKASPLDCILFDGSVTFVIAKEDGILLDRLNKEALSELSKIMKRRINVVVQSDELMAFVQSVFFPVPIEKMKVVDRPDGKKGLQVKVPVSKKGLAIGKEGANIRRARVLLNRYFEIEDVRVI